ncbi:hypothetical protein J2X97_000383 [Epilithonimonas hungarica]|uniref:hypothetical protein n=1 Tax=Epilithonimonas hungarica TaxID=454006 RepID=UPI002780F84D|nr:hypothetical protein [Epilithonimonas hungarica]MDP9954746.1 hypothetical protein [Epilithonimonas hungarica]
MRIYNISYKAPDYLRTGFLKGITIEADSMLQAVSIFAIQKPDCEIIGILQIDN